eukprot:3344461-Amphidinium_carterae.1
MSKTNSLLCTCDFVRQYFVQGTFAHLCDLVQPSAHVQPWRIWSQNIVDCHKVFLHDASGLSRKKGESP